MCQCCLTKQECIIDLHRCPIGLNEVILGLCKRKGELDDLSPAPVTHVRQGSGSQVPEEGHMYAHDTQEFEALA